MEQRSKVLDRLSKARARFWSESSQAVRDLVRLTSRRSFAASSAEMAVAALELERRLVAFLKQEEARLKR